MNRTEQAEAHLRAREIERALREYVEVERAGEGEPDRIDGGRWMCNMLAGEYEAAWRRSDAIRARGALDAHRFWTGEPIEGRRLMLRCLHGYGDTVMYLRWLPELRRRCSEVIVQACPEMLPLIEAMARSSDAAMQPVDRSAPVPNLQHSSATERPCPVRVVTWTQEGESDGAQWDVQVECAELPYLFRATTATLPEPVSFTFSEVELHRVRMRLHERTKPRVGLVWTGSNYDPARSIPFLQLRQIFGNHYVEFWSLQAPENNSEWAKYCAEHGWNERTFYTAEAATGDLQHTGIADMAAFASEMDLIVTIDTLAAHVAGSLGLPTWLLLKQEADWRWMLGREDSPWYPTMRLFRQHEAGKWNEPLLQVCDALRDFREEQTA